jgi:hypothetical protein
MSTWINLIAIFFFLTQTFVIDISFWLMSGDPTQGSTRDKARIIGRESLLGFSWVNIRIKMIIVIVLKPYLGIELRQGSGWPPSQCKDKNSYYHNFKTWLGDRYGAMLELQLEGLIRVDHNFITWLGSQSGARSRSRFKRINSGWPGSK